MLQKKGYKLFATGGSSKFLTENGVENTRVYWPSEPDMHPQALEMLHRKEIDMVVNIPKNLTAGELDNGYRIRRAAIDLNIPLITNARLASAFINAFCTMTPDDLAIRPGTNISKSTWETVPNSGPEHPVCRCFSTVSLRYKAEIP